MYGEMLPCVIAIPISLPTNATLSRHKNSPKANFNNSTQVFVSETNASCECGQCPDVFLWSHAGQFCGI